MLAIPIGLKSCFGSGAGSIFLLPLETSQFGPKKVKEKGSRDVVCWRSFRMPVLVVAGLIAPAHRGSLSIEIKRAVG
jgi:hypothetical protein